MKTGQDDVKAEAEGLGRAALRRRELLELGALGLGVGLPVVMTLVPRTARAEGSWQCVEGGQAAAQGSWSCRTGQGAGGMQRSRDWKTRMNEQKSMLGPAQERGQSFALPGSHEWRMRREAEEEQKRRARGDFSRFGSSDDWR